MKLFSALGDVLKKVGLPLLGSAIPGGGLIVDTLAKVLGTEPSEKAMIEAIQSHPEAVLKLKELEQTHERELIALALEKQKTELLDTQNARQRDIAIQTLRNSNRRADILAYGSMIGLLGVIAALLFLDIPEAGEKALLILVGTLNGIVMTVYTFEFGSSKGSKDKDAVIQEKQP